MSATMMNDRFMSGRRVISGVCVEVSERAGVPVWVPRVAFLLFAFSNWIFAALLYWGLATLWCSKRRRTARFAKAQPASSAFGPDVRYAADKFSRLDERLANLEAATLQRETELRRAFRDLERG